MFTRLKNRTLYALNLLVLVTILTTSFAQTTYYVANTGKDSNDGQSNATPFQSISRINKLALQPGDIILFRRGDTFRGTLQVQQSGTADNPIQFDAYGTGAKPVLAGSTLVKNWVNVGKNIWQANCPECGSRVTGMYRNGRSLPLGRYPNPDAPNRGYLTVKSHVGTSQLTSEQPLTGNWTGAEVVLFPTFWIIDRATITQQTGNTLTLANPSTYSLTDSWGYLIQNHPSTLDQAGEWYYNANTQSLLLYYDLGNPNTQTITATAADRCVDLANVSNIALKNLQLTQAKTEILYATNVSGLSLTNNDFTNSGEDGIVFKGTGTTLVLENNTITDINNNGLYIANYQNVTLRGNTMKRVAVSTNRGKSGDGQFSGIQSFASQNTLIEKNVIDSVGYIGLSVFNNTTVRQNIVSNFCLSKSDGGGIYLWNGTQLPLHNIQVESNIIRNGIGTTGSLAETVRSGAHGIFLDDCVNTVTLTNNTVSECQGLGIYLHAVSDVKLIGNTCFDNSIAQLILFNYDKPCLPRNNTLKQNILVAKTTTQSVAGYISGNNDLPDFGLMAQNYYCRPLNDVFTIRAVYNTSVVDDISLAQWQNQFRQDLTSKTSPLTYKEYRINSIGKRNLLTSTFTNTSEDWSTWSPYNNGNASWTNGSQLDGGSLKLAFSSPSGHSDSYIMAYKSIPAISKSKSYVLRFDAVAPALKKIAVFIRQKNSPYQDLTRRFEVLAGPAKKSYEVVFTALADESDALLTVQFQEDGQAVWLDNVWLQEATSEAVNPADFIRLFYNPTTKDSLITLDGSYRDVRNHYYTRNTILKPFSSVVLLRDSLPPVDVSLTLKADRTSLKVGDIVSFSLSLHNQSAIQPVIANKVEWACQLPQNMTVLTGAGFTPGDSLLRGSIQQLSRDTTIVFQLKATKAGQSTVGAQVTATTYADPDSTPDSGIGESEDDAATVNLSVRESSAADTVITATEPAQPPANANPVYPNPTGSSFSFIAEADITFIKVVDMVGRTCFSRSAIRRGEHVRFGDEFTTGYYNLVINYTSGNQRSIKLIKLTN